MRDGRKNGLIAAERPGDSAMGKNAKCEMQKATCDLEGRRVLIVLPTLDLGGAERQALLLAEYLKARLNGPEGGGVAVAALFGGTGRQAVRQACAQVGVACLRVSMPQFKDGIPTWPSVRQFMRELRFLGVDVMLPYTILPNTLCGLASRGCAGGALSVWNQRDAGVEMPGRWMQQRAMERTCAFVSNSQNGRDYLLGRGAAPQMIHVVPNGVRLAPPRMDRNRWREKLGLRDGDLAVCMIGNIQPLKDHETLLRAWAQVAELLRGPKIVLCLAGELGATAPALRQLADQLKISASLRWLGPVEDIAGLLRAMNLAVLSSRQEGLPNGVLEPMAAGLAVAATDVPGVREALGDEQQPYLAPAGDAQALAEKMVRLLEDQDQRQRLGAQNRQRIQDHFAVEKMGRAAEAVIVAALSRKPL